MTVRKRYGRIFSTFKIISTLMGLHNHVLVDETSVMHYDGSEYSVPDRNANLSLEEAFQSSCIWYFRQVIDEVGQEEVQNELEALDYGNCDVSEWKGSGVNPKEELNGFWLDSSLAISPAGWVNVLADIFEGKSGHTSEEVTILKQIMRVEESGNGTVYGKTGTGAGGTAWFVGFDEINEERTYFAVYLEDAEKSDQVSGSRAKEIAMEILKQTKAELLEAVPE